MTADALQNLLSQLALNDDADAYKKLFFHYHPKLLSFSYAITHNRQSSEEAVSDVFLNVWKGRKTLLRIANFQLYLYVSAKNISLNYLAKEKRAQVFSLDDVKSELNSLSYDPEQLLITAEMFKRIRTAVQALPPKCRLIFKLVKEDGLRYKEVAELLHLSVKTVEAQMGIALRRIGEAVYFRQPHLS